MKKKKKRKIEIETVDHTEEEEESKEEATTTTISSSLPWVYTCANNGCWFEYRKNRLNVKKTNEFMCNVCQSPVVFKPNPDYLLPEEKMKKNKKPKKEEEKKTPSSPAPRRSLSFIFTPTNNSSSSFSSNSIFIHVPSSPVPSGYSSFRAVTPVPGITKNSFSSP
jgi:hypothetical protein